MQLSRELDWVAKLELLEGYRSRDGLGWDAPSCSYSTCSTPMSGRTGACTTGSSPAAGWSASPTRPRSTGRSTTRPRTPGRTSAAGACGSTRTRWPPRPGTRSSSTSPAGSRCNGSPPWSRCAARGRTSGPPGPVPDGRRPGQRAHRSGISRTTELRSPPGIPRQDWTGPLRARIPLKRSGARAPHRRRYAMATKDTGGQRQTTRRTEETEEDRGQHGRRGQGTAREAVRRRRRDPR